MRTLGILFLMAGMFMLLVNIDNIDVAGTDLDHEAEEIKKDSWR